MNKARIAVNEATFRQVNEAIEAGTPATDAELQIICECGRLGCTEQISVTTTAYGAVRADRRRFIIVPGHELPEAERIVETGERYFVVEKVGEAGEIAEDLSRQPLPDLGQPSGDA